MYERIMIPVDLARVDELDRQVDAAAILGKASGAEMHLVAVTGKAKPHDGSHDTSAFERRLDEFAAGKGKEHGVTFNTRTILTSDAYSDLKKRIYEQVDELGVDLIVLGSHEPGWVDHFLPSTSTTIIKHVSCSVLVVR